MEKYSEVLIYSALEDPIFINTYSEIFLMRFNDKCTKSQVIKVVQEAFKTKKIDNFIKDKIISKPINKIQIPGIQQYQGQLDCKAYVELLDKDEGTNIVGCISIHQDGLYFFDMPNKKVPFQNDLRTENHAEVVSNIKTKKVIRAINEKFTENDSKVAEYKAGLSLWMMYFKSCHELEDSFEIKDENRNSQYDIAAREVKFNFEKHYNENYFGKFLNGFFERHPNYIKKYNRNITIAKILNFLPIILALIGAIGSAIPFFVNSSGFGKVFNIIFGIIIAGVVGVVVYFIVHLIVKAIISGPLKSSKIKFEDFVNQNISMKPDYKSELKEDFNKYKEYIGEKLDSFNSDLQSLRKVRAQLEKICPLKHYGYEKAVSYCLFLLDNNRASSYKEALNMFVDDEKTEKILQANSIINSSIQELNEKVDQAVATLSEGYVNTANRIADTISSMEFKIKK